MPRPTVYVAMQETAVERGRIDALLLRMRILEDRIAVLEAKPAATPVVARTPIVRPAYQPTPEQEARRAAFAAAREAAIAEAKRTGRPTAVVRPEGY